MKIIKLNRIDGKEIHINPDKIISMEIMADRVSGKTWTEIHIDQRCIDVFETPTAIKDIIFEEMFLYRKLIA